MPHGHRLPLLLVLLFSLVLAWSAPPLAADEAEDEKAPVGAPADGVEAGPEPVDEAPVLHKVYIPFRDLSKVFEKEGEGVFLPYEEFLELWKKAHGVEADAGKPPMPSAVRAAAYEGRADGEMVQLDAALEVEVLADGWQRIPLDFAGAGIEKALVDGEAALLVPAAQGGGYELLLKDAGRRTLTLSLRIAAARVGDRHTAAFSLPAVPLSRLKLSVPGSATEVEVTPRLASTTQPHESGRTELVAFLGPVSRIQIAWTQQVDEGPRVEPLVFADERHDVRVDRGVLRSELVADLSVLRAPLGELELAVPSDAVTLYVQGDGIRTWTRSDDGKAIRVVLREPVKESWQLRIGLERPLPDLPADVPLPLAAIQKVERETGFVRLLMGEGVKLEPRVTPGLLQVDVNELPDPLKGAPPGRALAYRFPARPGVAVVAVEALAPRITTTAGTRLVVRPEGTDLRYVANLLVERSGIFGVALDLPAGLEVTAVRVRGVEYDDHKVNLAADGRRWLAVEFRDRLLGAARLEVDGRLATPLPAGEEDESEVSFVLPLPSLEGSDHVNGYVAVHLDSALDHRVMKKEGLVVLDAGAAAAIEPPVVQGVNVPLAYRFEHHAEGTALTLGLKRRAPAVTARVETSFRLEPDRTTVRTVLRYQVRYRGIDTMRFTAPLGLDTRMHLDLEGVQLLGPQPVEPGGEDGETGKRGIWTVKLPSPRTGVIPIPIEIEDVPEDTLTSGQSRSVVLSSFVPLGDDGEPLPNTVHDLAVQRNRLLEVVSEKLERAEEIDPRELPPALRTDDNFLAFRSYDPAWAVRLHATRHDYEPVAEVVVSHMHLDTVFAADGRGTTEAYLVIQSNNRQNLELTLPPNATIRAVTVDGESRSPREGDEGRVLIPLPSGLGKDQAFVVALAYDHDVERSSSLGFATTSAVSPVASDVVADLLTWRVFAPDDRTYTSFGGSVEPADPYHSWFASLVQGLSQTLGQQAQGRNVHPASVARGFKSPFPSEHVGEDFLFSNRVGTGTVALTGVEPGLFAFWKLFFFALVVAGTLVLARVARVTHLGEGKVFAAALLVLLVLLVRAGPGTAQVLNAMLYGVLVAGLVRLLVLMAGARRARAAAAAEAARNAPPRAPSEPGEPAPEGGAA